MRQMLAQPQPMEDDALALHAAETPQDECELAAALICAWREQGLRYRDILVTARDFAAYEPWLTMALSRYDIPAFFSQRHDILSRPVLALPLCALRVVDEGFRAGGCGGFLKTGLTGPGGRRRRPAGKLQRGLVGAGRGMETGVGQGPPPAAAARWRRMSGRCSISWSAGANTPSDRWSGWNGRFSRRGAARPLPGRCMIFSRASVWRRS